MPPLNRTLGDSETCVRAAWAIVLTLLTASADGAVPVLLADALAEHRCVDIPDDAEMLKNRNRWWFSLEPITGGAGDFAFYCQNVADPRAFRLILVISGDGNPWQGCESVVDSWRESRPWLPYDLAVVNAAPRYERHVNLGQWWLVSSSNNATVTYGPAGVTASDPIIDTTGGSAGTLYACYSREWYRIGLD